MSTERERGSVAIILHSAAYDRASYALTLTLVALATGMEAHMLLTHGGLRRFSKGRLEEIGGETDPQAQKDVNFALMAGAVNSLEQQLADARELGLRLYACTGAMAILNLRPEDLLPEVDEAIGLATFFELARAASVNWYI